MENRGQFALVGGLVAGIMSLVIGVIVAFVIISNISGSKLLAQQSDIVTNETNAWLNATSYPLSKSTLSGFGSPTITKIWGAQGGKYNVTIPVANATVTNAGSVTNATTVTNNNVSYTYSYLADTSQIVSSNGLSGNLTSGVDNVSEQLPTVLLIAAIVLILGILATLVAVWQKMRMGSSL